MATQRIQLHAKRKRSDVLTLVARAVPVGVRGVEIEIPREGWTQGTTVDIEIEQSPDGVNWFPWVSARAVPTETLPIEDQTRPFNTGVRFLRGGNNNASLQARGSITITGEINTAITLLLTTDG